MRLFVCIKQVPDTETRIKIAGDQIDLATAKWVINPYDEYAVEEAVKIKEAGGQGKVTVIAVGPKARTVNSLRTAMAMGADDGIVIDTNEALDSLTTARAIAEAIKKEGEEGLIFAGKLAIDDNMSAVPPMVAELLGLSHVSNVVKLEKSGEQWTIEREVEGGGKEIFTTSKPLVVSANKGLNKPRFASLPGIMKAKAKPLKELTLADLGLGDVKSKTKYKGYELPAEKQNCQMLSGSPAEQVDELVRKLREEAKVI